MVKNKQRQMLEKPEEPQIPDEEGFWVVPEGYMVVDVVSLKMVAIQGEKIAIGKSAKNYKIMPIKAGG